jgi:hypothetical protein
MDDDERRPEVGAAHEQPVEATPSLPPRGPLAEGVWWRRQHEAGMPWPLPRATLERRRASRELNALLGHPSRPDLSETYPRHRLTEAEAA